LPVRLRRVASGLMIENVRSSAIAHSFDFCSESLGCRLIAARLWHRNTGG